MLKQAIVSALLLAALGARAEVINIDNAELARLSASGVAIIDIRTGPEWKETGVIPGSKLMTFYNENGQSDPQAWLEKLRTVVRPDQPVVLICRSGNRTRAATQFLSQQGGYKTVYNASTGIASWAKEGRPTVPASTSMAGCGPGARC